MKKILFTIAAFLGVSCTTLFAQTISITNKSSCRGIVSVNVQANDGTQSCPNFAFSTTIANGSGLWGGSSWLPTDFNNPGPLAPVGWNGGMSISVAPYAWDLAQCMYGTSGAVSDPTYFTCIPGLTTTATMTAGGCTVNMQWSEAPSGDVQLLFY